MQSQIFLAAAILTGLGFAAPGQAQPLPPQLAYNQPLSAPAVQSVQEKLHQAGDYAGRIDGVWGADSVVALQRFQQAHGLQVTGQLNQATVATLGLNTDVLLQGPQTAAGPVVAAPPATGTLAPESVRAVQGRLRGLGFYHGLVDGVWGPSTQAAIAEFQHSRGLEPNSQLNPATVAALGLQPGTLAVR